MLTPAQESECKKLKELFIKKSPLSQKAFALKYGFGTPGNLWQYLNVPTSNRCNIYRQLHS